MKLSQLLSAMAGIVAVNKTVDEKVVDREAVLSAVQILPGGDTTPTIPLDAEAPSGMLTEGDAASLPMASVRLEKPNFERGVDPAAAAEIAKHTDSLMQFAVDAAITQLQASRKWVPAMSESFSICFKAAPEAVMALLGAMPSVAILAEASETGSAENATGNEVSRLLALTPLGASALTK